MKKNHNKFIGVIRVLFGSLLTILVSSIPVLISGFIINNFFSTDVCISGGDFSCICGPNAGLAGVLCLGLDAFLVLFLGLTAIMLGGLLLVRFTYIANLGQATGVIVSNLLIVALLNSSIAKVTHINSSLLNVYSPTIFIPILIGIPCFYFCRELVRKTTPKKLLIVAILIVLLAILADHL